MKDENMKEILDKFDKVLENYELDKKWGQMSVNSICHLFPNEMIIIKDYITNLQKEKKKYEEFVNELRKIVNGELVPRYHTNSERAKFHFNEGWSLFKSFVEDRMAKFIGEDKDVNITN